MKRRDFLAAACLSGAATMSTFAANVKQSENINREYYELRKYQVINRSNQKPLNDFLRDAALPAMNRIGIEPVGVFNGMYGPDSSTLYMLIPHKSLESFITASLRITDDAEYQKKGASFLNAPILNPAYVRMESSLMAAFKNIPKIELPKISIENKPRIFELRTYESHSVKAATRKIHMFNEGGEIQIFRDTGLQPVFFGQALVGPRMPNLTYMLAFDNMEARDKNWNVFRNSSGWQKLRVNPFYADTVSNITDVILQPAPYSQI